MPDAAPGGIPSSTRAMSFSVGIPFQEPAFSLPPAPSAGLEKMHAGGANSGLWCYTGNRVVRWGNMTHSPMRDGERQVDGKPLSPH
jgi:hypothetical protein